MDNDLTTAELDDLEMLGEFSDLDGPVEVSPTRIRRLVRMAKRGMERPHGVCVMCACPVYPTTFCEKCSKE